MVDCVLGETSRVNGLIISITSGRLQLAFNRPINLPSKSASKPARNAVLSGLPCRSLGCKCHLSNTSSPPSHSNTIPSLRDLRSLPANPLRSEGAISAARWRLGTPGACRVTRAGESVAVDVVGGRGCGCVPVVGHGCEPEPEPVVGAARLRVIVAACAPSLRVSTGPSQTLFQRLSYPLCQQH